MFDFEFCRNILVGHAGGLVVLHQQPAGRLGQLRESGHLAQLHRAKLAGEPSFCNLLNLECCYCYLLGIAPPLSRVNADAADPSRLPLLMTVLHCTAKKQHKSIFFRCNQSCRYRVSIRPARSCCWAARTAAFTASTCRSSHCA